MQICWCFRLSDEELVLAKRVDTFILRPSAARPLGWLASRGGSSCMQLAGWLCCRLCAAGAAAWLLRKKPATSAGRVSHDV